MTTAPGDLTLSRHRDLAGRTWHPWFRRGLLALVGVLPLLALANLFGQHPDTSTADTSAAKLIVYAPKSLRGGDMFEVRVRILAHQALKHPTLVLDSGWFEQVTLNGIAPQPSDESGHDDQVLYHYSPLDAGKAMTVWIYYQINPTNVGHRSARISLADGAQTIASIPRTITVFP